jgi:hypothetical protein
MSSPFNGLKTIVARLQRILTSSHEPKSRRARRARLGLERLEVREVLSASFNEAIQVPRKSALKPSSRNL